MNEFRNRKITQSFKDAFNGIWLCICGERNMRIHTVVAIYLLFFTQFLNVTRVEYAVLFLVVAVMLTAEAFNTAIEKLCDFVCNQKDRRIGVIKDIAAGAVLVSALTAVCIGVIVLFKPNELLVLFNKIISNFWYVVALVTSAVVAVIYIIIGPIGITEWFYTKNNINKKHK